MGLLAFPDHFRSHAAAALLECLTWAHRDYPDSFGPPPTAERAAACRVLLGHIYADWGHEEIAEWYGVRNTFLHIPFL